MFVYFCVRRPRSIAAFCSRERFSVSFTSKKTAADVTSGCEGLLRYAVENSDKNGGRLDDERIGIGNV